MSILAKAMLFVTLTVPLTGCVLDLNKLAAELRKPSVTFAERTAWRCDQAAQHIPTAKGLESCDMCLNTHGPQVVTINKTEQTVPRGGQVAICQTVAFPVEP